MTVRSTRKLTTGTTADALTWAQRLDALRDTKLKQTREKIDVVGSMDRDDWGLVLPPPDRRKIVETISTSGVPIRDILLEGFAAESNHPSGGFFGPKACGENFARLLRSHPAYIDPMSSLAGGYMANFMAYRKPQWNPDLAPPADKTAIQQKYQLVWGIGATQHFCQDLALGLRLGWAGILEKVRRCRKANAPRAAEFYDGLEAVVLGMQDWIGRHALEARRLGESELDEQLRANLFEVAELNERLVTAPPRSFREACQWILWFDMAARMYNGSGSLGRLDVLLTPYYERESAAGTLTDDEAIFHLACLLLRDTAYIQLGGPDADGRDVTNRVSFLVLEAAHRLRIPANIGVAVGPNTSPELLRRGVEIMFADKAGIPKFLAAENTARDFARNGYPIELGRQRIYSGCHWLAIPGREYTINDCVKINLAVVFDVALREMMASGATPSAAELWNSFARCLREAVAAIAFALDFHLEHMHEVFPELVMDLLCHGPIEKGLDASHGGVEFYNMCCDAAALATVADSFAAVEQRVEREKRMTWQQLLAHLDSDWAGADGERARLMMQSVPRYGSGGSRADDYALRVSRLFTELVAERRAPQLLTASPEHSERFFTSFRMTECADSCHSEERSDEESPPATNDFRPPNGVRMIPGLFSWASTIGFGANLGATPNGRRKGAPISHGCNPNPGFRKDAAPTALAVAVASVQPARGNTAPMQIELDPALGADDGGIDAVANLIRTHFELGGTQINMNIVDAERIRQAHADPSKFPDLIVRVTGFSAYFAALSEPLRQLIVDRMIDQGT